MPWTVGLRGYFLAEHARRNSASTFFAGTALYVTLMTTGTLIVGMVLHALWDFGTLGILATDAKQRTPAGVLALVTFAAALASVWFVIAAA